MPRRKADRHARLGWLVDGEFEAVAGLGPNRKAADATVKSMSALGRVEDIDQAVVTAFRMLAEAVDNDPTNSGLWAQYMSAEATLRVLGSGDGDALDEFLRTEMGDSEDAG